MGIRLIFKGNRSQMNVIYTLGMVSSALCLWAVLIDNKYVFSASFFIFGPQLQIAMTAAGNSHKYASGVSTGFVSLFACIGASAARYPLSEIIEGYQWDGFYSLLLMLTGVLVVLLFIAMQ